MATLPDPPALIVVRPFRLDINLDDEQECAEFWEKYCITSHPRLARLLGLKGKGSFALACDLHCYAANKMTAIRLRTQGDIGTAQAYENICDRIYKRNIQPVCECW